MTFRAVSLTLAVCLLGACDVFAGGWTQKKNEGFYKLDFRALQTDQYYSPQGNKTDITTTGEYIAALYAEYGVFERLTVTGYLPFKRLTLNKLVDRQTDIELFEGDSESGPGDVDIGVRYLLMDFGAAVVSSSLTLGLPLGSDSQENGLFTGDGEFNQLLALEGGYSFYPASFFATVMLGVNNRTSGFSDELRYGFQLGYEPIQPLLFTANITGVKSLENGDDDVGGTSGFAGNDVEYLSYGLEAMYTVSGPFGVTAGFSSATFGKNVLAAPVFSVGVFSR